MIDPSPLASARPMRRLHLPALAATLLVSGASVALAQQPQPAPAQKPPAAAPKPPAAAQKPAAPVPAQAAPATPAQPAAPAAQG